ncbi:MAG: hypothetical protein AAB604_00395 [Patescibacteria group bacterium]|jgi:hypothetical protein
MAFISLKQIITTSVPLSYTKKTDHDIEKYLKKQFLFLINIPFESTAYHIIFSPSSSLESQQIFWYRQEIQRFLADNNIHKQIKIIYAP